MAGLYFHIPFCLQKCSYCDFYSFIGTKEDLQDYPGLLKKHLSLITEKSFQEKIRTIYFGGGTPSLLDPAIIGEIIEELHRTASIDDRAEITLEVNPGTVTPEKLTGYHLAGINRLSLGLQSVSEHRLQQLGRTHSQRDSFNTFEWARKAGFNNLSLDLMFALPGQTTSELEVELTNYLSLSPEHISCYGLTAEPETPFYHKVASGKETLPDGDEYAEAYMLIHDQLTSAGFEHYEIANYARKGYQCRHNEAYWQRKPYFGIGAGAHTFIANNWGSRWQVPDDLNSYRHAITNNNAPEICLETFSRESALKESVYLGLRTSRGISDRAIKEQFNVNFPAAFSNAIGQCTDWLQHNSGNWSLTPEGWLIFDRLILHFL